MITGAFYVSSVFKVLGHALRALPFTAGSLKSFASGLGLWGCLCFCDLLPLLESFPGLFSCALRSSVRLALCFPLFFVNTQVILRFSLELITLS